MYYCFTERKEKFAMMKLMNEIFDIKYAQIEQVLIPILYL